MSTPRRRPSLPVVLASAALAVALVSSPLPGQAAGLIKGKQIARNAITTPKIKNNAVTTPKIKNNAVTGPKIRNNVVGSAKITNGSIRVEDLAADVLPTAFWNEVGGNVGVPTAFTDVVSVVVPAGSYAVTASASLTNITGASQDARCRIFDGTSGMGTMRPFDLSAQKTNDTTVAAVVTFAGPGTLSLQCRSNSVDTIFTASSSSPQILAIKVGQVEIQ